MATVEEQVTEILLSILDVKPEEIVPTATLMDLNATSIDIVEILTAIQNTFDVNITEEEAQKIRTVGDAIDRLKAALAAKDAKA